MDVKKITSLIIEPTNTCNLRCTFCFVTDGMTRDGGFMDFNIFKKIIDDCTDLEHLCMHNWGEPLLHKDIFRMIEYAKNKGVNYVVMNTNGTLLTDKMINRIVNSKLDIIRFSIDGSAETFKRVRGVELENIEKNIKKLKIIKEKKKPELKMGVVFTVEEDTEGDAEEYINHWEKIVDHVRLQPKLITSPRTEVCPEPFGKDYGKLVVLWDGRVIPCCVDYNANLMIGNIQNDTIPNLWKSEKLNILREQHLKGEFPDTCANCNECESNKADKRFFVNALTK
ncbi:MAG: radical SAM/SPASM domain-containing protein [Nitrospinaceae bacterium]|nr:radical SAM protein [Nitrospina sp.]MBT6663034.1 radical SAM protein [Nitrospina sp.]MDG1843878.1 radical SAM/SPASM domain-containing protein [Nitrospinaceae bacterium]